MSPEAELIEAANDLAAALSKVPKLQIHREKSLPRAHRKIAKLYRDRFRKQRTAVLKGHLLRNVFDALSIAHAREADDTRKMELRAEIVAGLGSVIQDVEPGSSKAFDGAITQAIDAGASGIADHLNITQGDTESFVAGYLKDNGFTKLTGELDQTTVERLASSIADAYEGGENFEGILSAVKSEFRDFTTARAKMIAQTELNDAYNQSILHFGEEAGGAAKSWEIEPGACIVCVENALAGEIPISDSFPSGDDAPTAHPLCNCSLMVHA